MKTATGRPGQRPWLHRFRHKRIQKFSRGFGTEQARAYRIVFYKSCQCADANQVIINQLLRHSDHENKMGAHSVVAKGNASATTSDPKNDFIDQISAGMGKDNAVFDYAGMRPLARENLFEKFLRLIGLPVFSQQLDDLAQCIRRFSGAQSQDHLLFIEKINQRDSHWRQRDLLDYPAKHSYPVNLIAVATEKIPAGSNEEATVSLQRSIYDPGYVNAMSHFYRGEMGRIMVWRQRLDITTNWAITSSTAIITIAFTTREVPHIIFFFNLAIVWAMLWIEARRYRFYDAFRARVRMLEAHFLVPMVMENREMLHGEWKKLVCEDLILPCFKISKLEAVGRRLKRNYIFIFILIMIAWVTKIFLHASAPIEGPRSFYHALRIGHIPSWLVAFIFIGTLVCVIAITIYVSRKSTGEISEFGTHRSLWRI